MDNYKIAVQTVTMIKTLSRKDIENICIKALEGGVGHWAELNKTNPNFLAARQKHEGQPTSIIFARGLMDGIEMTFDSNESPETWLMNIDDLLAGISQYYQRKDEWGHILEHRILEINNWGCEQADLAFQLGIFGKEVFDVDGS